MKKGDRRVTHIWAVIRQVQHYQTSETLKIEVVQAVTGDSEEAVKRKAENRVAELEREQGGHSVVDYTPLYTFFWAANAPVITPEEGTDEDTAP